MADIVTDSRNHWDVIVVGAGPAGSVAAALLAERGWRVLLVDRGRWPREKTCGGCLNGRAVRMLRQLGLGVALRGGGPIDRSVWHVGRQSLSMDAPGGVAILRAQFDSALVKCAQERGCTFESGVSARLLPRDDFGGRTVQLRSNTATDTVRAGMVLACDGVNGPFLNDEPWAKWHIASNAWMGVSTTYSDRGDDLKAATIRMDVGAGGYVGRVRLADGQVHLAAALNPKACKRTGGPGPLVGRILQSCGSNESMHEKRFNATGLLTRRRRHLGGHRVLAVGDACGYVEPFTGEGMGWAIAAAVEVDGILPQGSDWPSDLPRQWERRHAEIIERRQRWCLGLRPMMHHPMVAGLGIGLGRMAPPAGAFVSRAVAT